MTARRIHPWAAAAAMTMTVAIGSGIGVLADVDAPATGLPVVQLDAVEVRAARPLPAASVEAAQLRRQHTL